MTEPAAIGPTGLRCQATNLKSSGGGQCRSDVEPGATHRYCKHHARKLGAIKLCLQCGLWHEPGRHRKPTRTE